MANEAAAAAAAALEACEGYGPALRERFGLEAGYTQLNHGSFGTCPKEVNDNRKALLDHVETNPDVRRPPPPPSPPLSALSPPPPPAGVDRPPRPGEELPPAPQRGQGPHRRRDPRLARRRRAR